MKVTVITPTRARPLALVGSLMAAWRLRSTKHDLTFIVGADDDDTQTHDAVTRLAAELPVIQTSGPRSTLGHVMNRMMNAARGDCDVVTTLTDRTFCITPGWDDCIAETLKLRSNRILWWSCPYDPDCNLPAIPAQWCDALDWQWSPEIFPFWWDDTWLQELDLMVFGGPSLKMITSYAGERKFTTNGRDFAFWFDVFARTREQRWQKAEKIAERLGVQLQPRENLEKYFALYDAAGQQRSPSFEDRFGDKRPASAAYLRAKTAAQAMIGSVAAAC